MSQLNHSDTSQSGLNGEEVLILMLNASGMIQYRIFIGWEGRGAIADVVSLARLSHCLGILHVHVYNKCNINHKTGHSEHNSHTSLHPHTCTHKDSC